MKEFRHPLGAGGALKLFLAIAFIISTFAHASAQEGQSQTAAAEPVPETETVQRRVTRARSLAAVGKLAAAAQELETLRASSTDESVRDVARVLLMNIFVEMPDYARANALLDEAFRARVPKSESAERSYYALAGQTVRSVRAHIERYRSFGINVADDELPTEAAADLEQLRVLLGRVFEQAKSIREEESKDGVGGAEATALIEEVASARLKLARGEDDRTRWLQEISDARQRLIASETRIGKISDAPVLQVASVSPALPGAYNSYPSPANMSAPADAKARQAANGNAPIANLKTAPAASKTAEQPKADAGTKKSDGAPVAVGPLHARAEKKVDPSYPQIAKLARVSGVVTVHIIINEQGIVESVLRADGPLHLQGAATDAVRRWKFKPILVNGHPARASGYVSFKFAL